ncbi:hypothetical protein E2C01_049571 [Portunus trituberculatus]|uniref:Uncharacterized protein n=1 Tax=Portunus trituberculatus TaxID=210409 RepID=A0A5B7GDH7_PORTR|nr:hypothetical protein [Portunus trituberculatus]
MEYDGAWSATYRPDGFLLHPLFSSVLKYSRITPVLNKAPCTSKALITTSLHRLGRLCGLWCLPAADSRMWHVSITSDAPERQDGEPNSPLWSPNYTSKFPENSLNSPARSRLDLLTSAVPGQRCTTVLGSHPLIFPARYYFNIVSRH